MNGIVHQSNLCYCDAGLIEQMAHRRKERGSISTYHLVADRQMNTWNYASQLQIFSHSICSKLYWCFKEGAGAHKLYQGSYGSVFNLEFSPVEDIALAVLENRAIIAYDPRTNSKIHVVPHAHEDAVNCISFLDSCNFVTCSDDQTIKLWDLRHPGCSMATLRGHKNWVKNIEYDRRSGLLFSVAFFDGIRYWDLNKLDSYVDEDVDNLAISVPNPTRMRLSPDGSTMFVSTKKNFSLIINNFDGKTLHMIRNDVKRLLAVPSDQKLCKTLKEMKTNRPSVHHMSGLRGERAYRAVMSVTYHPSGKFVGLRHLDIRNESLIHELTTLYNTEESEYSPICRIQQTTQNFLKYVDEFSEPESYDYIKEICFSPDGRILASPYKDGVRLLAVDSWCTPMDLYFDPRFHSSEKSLCNPDFEEVAICKGHSSNVLTCKFAHHDLIVGTGCMQGKVLFHKPQL